MECESTDDESDANSEARKRDDDVERVFGNGGRTGNQSASSNSGLKVYNGIVDPSVSDRNSVRALTVSSEKELN